MRGLHGALADREHQATNLSPPPRVNVVKERLESHRTIEQRDTVLHAQHN